MTELFDIFGERLTNNSIRGIPRQPLSNNENIGKPLSTGPVKPNEPLKKAGDTKKSFLSNTGLALRDIQTPVQKVLTPRSKNVHSSAVKSCSQLIYTDELDDDAKSFYEELEFTRPAYRNENYDPSLMDYFLGSDLTVWDSPPPKTPPPATQIQSMELDSSYQDTFLNDDFEADHSSFGEDDFASFLSD